MKKITTIIVAAAIACIAIDSCKKKHAVTADKNDIAGSYTMTGLSIVRPDGEVNYMPAIENIGINNLLIFRPDKTYTYNGPGLNQTSGENNEGSWDYQGRDSLLLNGFPVSIISKTNSQLVLLADRSEDGIGLVFKATYQKV